MAISKRCSELRLADTERSHERQGSRGGDYDKHADADKTKLKMNLNSPQTNRRIS